MERPEVVVTGLGVVSAYGWEVERFYDELAAGRVALRPTPWMVAGITGMARGEVLHTACSRNVDPEVGFTVVLDEPRGADVAALQFNAFGFGGQDASLVLTRG